MRQCLEESTGLPRTGHQRVDVKVMFVPIDQLTRLHHFAHGIRIAGCINHPAGGNATSQYTPD